MSLARAGADFLPFLRAGSAVLMRTTLLLGTKTLATAVAARSVLEYYTPSRAPSILRKQCSCACVAMTISALHFQHLCGTCEQHCLSCQPWGDVRRL